jgi:hypothetical protein
MIMDRWRLSIAAAALVAIGLSSCGEGLGSSSTNGDSPAAPSAAAATAKGGSYEFSAPSGWSGGPAPATEAWSIERIPEGGAPGVAWFFDLTGTEDWVAIGERAVPEAAILKGWVAKLKALHTTDYQKICGRTTVERRTMQLSDEQATIATFNCPDHGSVDAVVSSVHNGYGLLITCHSTNRTVPAERAECQRVLGGLKFTS